jgi:hypothetical protein
MSTPPPPSWLETCVRAALADRDLVAEFDRIHGTNLRMQGTGLEIQIDLACGRAEHDLQLFTAFIHETVATRVPPPEPPPA